MNSTMIPALERLAKAIRTDHLRDLFERDPQRFKNFSVHAEGILLDYSKNQINQDVMDGLFALARERGVAERRQAMFAAEPINETEGRAVLHMALRAPRDADFSVDGKSVMGDIHGVLEAMEAFSNDVRKGTIKGATGKAFRDVVNIGIGGSDLGPVMVVSALEPYHDGPRCHFVSNVDGAHMSDTLKDLDPETTLVLVCSKTFTTHETMTNAASARAWLSEALGEAAVKDHFAAISTNIAKAEEFGINAERIFGFWDWVGGRYSVWSAIGLSVMLAVGPAHFRRFLAGAHAMDEHFVEAPLEQNLPVILGLLGVWYRNFMDCPTHGVMPYDQRLSRFSAYLQQLDMESNGKQMGLDGVKVSHQTGPVIWGEPGTNGQHAFYQLIHQGTMVIPCDFLLAANAQEDLGDHHAILSANCFAQAEALMLGKTIEEVREELSATGMSDDEIEALAPHKVFPGNRPSNVLLYETLDPYRLGSLIALYEHKVFVQGVIWGVNSYDQWGVELGKQLAVRLLPMVRDGAPVENKDSSTSGLIAALHQLKN
ncbi:MAG: glucose-6-phosphate isomerase [Hyphomicrobiales bacterium]